MSDDALTDLHARIEIIESGYEYMLAFAAQGYEPTEESSQDYDIRNHLQAMDKALDGLAEVTEVVATDSDGDNAARYMAFLKAVHNDAEIAQGAIRLILLRVAISSQLVDNLNASIHLRALLTDLFLLDEAFKR